MKKPATPAEFPAAEQAQAIAEDAYIYGYPLVLMDVIRRMCTSVPAPTADRAPKNQFAHIRSYLHTHQGILRANADALYSLAWLDLSKQPIVLTVPATSRYYVFSLINGWTDVFSVIGSRTTCGQEQSFAIIGPNWEGEVSSRLQHILAPTDMVWIVGRTQSSSQDDLGWVHTLQDQFGLLTLSDWTQSRNVAHAFPFDSDVDNRPPAEQVSGLTAGEFFTRFIKLLQHNPPADDDSPIIHRMERIGLVPSLDFNFDNLPEGVRSACKHAIPVALKRIQNAEKQLDIRRVNNWTFHPRLGSSAADYLTRAYSAAKHLALDLPEDVLELECDEDDDGESLKGSHQYVIHFTKEQMPPVHGFWSITAYDVKQCFVANPIDRYSIGDNHNLRFNADGSLDICVQNEWPGVCADSNWLPVPKRSFSLTLRLYWTRGRALDGTWAPPRVQRIRE
jgi:hypothetical protein